MSAVTAERTIIRRERLRWPNAWTFGSYEGSEPCTRHSLVLSASSNHFSDHLLYTVWATSMRAGVYYVGLSGEGVLGGEVIRSISEAPNVVVDHSNVIVAEREHAIGLWSNSNVVAPGTGSASFSIPVAIVASAATAVLGPSALSEEIVQWVDPLAGYEKYAASNWDHYGAEPITNETLEAARTFLTMLPDTLGVPDIAPSSDGAIALEWAFSDRLLRKLFIDVGPGYAWSGYWRLANDETGTIQLRPITGQTKFELLALFKNLNS